MSSFAPRSPVHGQYGSTPGNQPWKPPGRYRSSTSPVRSLSHSRATTRSSLSTRPSTGFSECRVDVKYLGEEYIHDLQQQVYVLELENECLRGHSKKAEDAARHLTGRVDQHASRAASSSLQSEDLRQQVAELNLDLRQKRGTLLAAENQCQQLQQEIDVLQATKEAERRSLLGELTSVHDEARRVAQDADRCKQQESSVQTALSATKRLLAKANHECQELKYQMETVSAQREELRTRETRHKAEIRELKCSLESAKQKDAEHEDCVARSHYKLVKEDGMSSRTELKKVKLEQDHLILAKKKVEETCGQLVHENSELRSKNISLDKQLKKVKAIVEHRDQQRQSMIKELVELRETREDMQHRTACIAEKEIRQGELLQHEQHALKERDDELEIAHAELDDVKLKLAHLEAKYRASYDETMSLQSEKAVLVDQSEEKDFQISTQHKDLERLKSANETLRGCLADLGARKPYA